jgi:hypothetical protein
MAVLDMLSIAKAAVGAAAVLITEQVPLGTAGFVQGHELYAQCSPTVEPGCLTYIVGVVDAIWISRSGPCDHRACVPSGLVDGQTLVSIFLKYITKDPRRLNTAPAACVVAAAMQEVFPCSEK